MGHHDHHHHEVSGSRLLLTILLNVIITVAQVIGGLLSGSLSLLSDAAHNFSDVIALIVSFIGKKLSVKPFTDAKTFGYKRAEILAALINVISVMFIGAMIFIEAMDRLTEPQTISGVVVMALAGLSIILNGISVLLIKSEAGHNLNIKSAYMHLFSDMLTSIAVMVSGFAIWMWQWYWLDTVLSVAISLYLIMTSVNMLLQTLSILMLFAPKTYDSELLVKEVLKVDEVVNVHHVHAWQLTDRDFHFEGHLIISKDLCLSETQELKKYLKEVIRKHGFTHVTLELEFEKCIEEGCEPDHHDHAHDHKEE